jgi:fructose-bisphosphate aldolase class II|tara:strand:+ start:396 stop:1223 length:828 start_codon:yes stop_codon:yes gene_type:complete
MTLATLKEVLKPAMEGGYAVAGLVTLGWEDMLAYVRAAEEENVSIILQAGPSCRAHTPLPILGKMFNHLANEASVPVVSHLDHGYTEDECKEAIQCGFTSIMFDGSKFPLQENIDKTARIVELAHEASVSCEGEIGFVGYSDGAQSAGTKPSEAQKFGKETNVDAMAISVGNVHLQKNKEANLDLTRIREIEQVTATPLVIHGGSGVTTAQRSFLAQNSKICKFNIGTELRMAFGKALRKSLDTDPDQFDRVQILSQTHDPLVDATRKVLRAFKS